MNGISKYNELTKSLENREIALENRVKTFNEEVQCASERNIADLRAKLEKDNQNHLEAHKNVLKAEYELLKGNVRDKLLDELRDKNEFFKKIIKILKYFLIVLCMGMILNYFVTSSHKENFMLKNLLQAVETNNVFQATSSIELYNSKKELYTRFFLGTKRIESDDLFTIIEDQGDWKKIYYDEDIYLIPITSLQSSIPVSVNVIQNK